MKNPVVLAWLYLAVGIVAVAAASFFLWRDYVSADASWAVPDLVLLGMAIYGIYKGSRDLRRLKQPQEPEK